MPRLDTPPSHEKLVGAMPPDLRGARYAKLPSSAEGLHGDDERHPLPCYTADEETFAPVKEMPWVIEKKKKAKEMADEWDRNPANADAVTTDLLQEAEDEELQGMAEEAISEAKEGAEANEVISAIVEDEFLQDGVDDQVNSVVWTVLYDMARSMKLDALHDMKNEFTDLAMDEKDLDVLSNHIMEGNAWITDLKGEKILSSTPWSKLVYNYSHKLHQDSMTCNAALNMLQETVAGRAALSELVTVGLLSSAEDDLQTIDDLEQAISPPRRG